MRTRSHLRLLRAGLALPLLLGGAAWGAPADKTMICHLAKSDGFYEPLEVADTSLRRHLAHGDCVIDDGVACTRDACDPAGGCVHAPDDGVCNDGCSATAWSPAGRRAARS